MYWWNYFDLPKWIGIFSIRFLSVTVIFSLVFNSLTTSDAYMRQDPCELSISLWEFIWSIKY